MSRFLKLECITHYKAKNQYIVKTNLHEHLCMNARTHTHIVDGLKRQDFSDHLKDASMLVFDDLTSMDLCVYCCYYCVDISTILCALFHQLFVLHICTQFCIYCLCFMFLFGALCTVVVRWVLMLHVCVH